MALTSLASRLAHRITPLRTRSDSEAVNFPARCHPGQLPEAA